MVTRTGIEKPGPRGRWTYGSPKLLPNFLMLMRQKLGSFFFLSSCVPQFYHTCVNQASMFVTCRVIKQKKDNCKELLAVCKADLKLYCKQKDKEKRTII